MNVKVSFEEIANYVAKHYVVRPELKCVDGKSLEVSYSPSRFIPPMSVCVRIEGVRKDVVCLSYECGMGMSLLIAGAVTHLGSKLPHGVEVNTDEKRVNIFLERIDEIQRVLEFVQLEGIHVCEDGVEILVGLK